MALMMALIMTKTVEKEEINTDDMNENDVIISHRKRRNISVKEKNLQGNEENIRVAVMIAIEESVVLLVN